MLASFDQTRIFLSYTVAQYLEAMVKTATKATPKPNFASGYAKYAILAACGVVASNPRTKGNLKEEGATVLKLVIDNWSKFEQQSQAASQNAKYTRSGSFSSDNYYKGDTVDADVKAFFAAV